MENPSLMCRLQSAGDLDCQAHGLLSLQGASQRAALDVLQHEIIRPNVVDLADMRMIQRGNRTRFLLESSRVLGLQPLNRDDAVQPRVVRLPDLTHAARPEGRQNLVRPKLITDSERHISDSVKFSRSNGGLLLDDGYPEPDQRSPITSGWPTNRQMANHGCFGKRRRLMDWASCAQRTPPAARTCFSSSVQLI